MSGLDLDIPIAQDKVRRVVAALMKVANDKKILNDHVNSLTSNVIGWITIGVMGIAVVILFFTWKQQ